MSEPDRLRQMGYRPWSKLSPAEQALVSAQLLASGILLNMGEKTYWWRRRASDPCWLCIYTPRIHDDK